MEWRQASRNECFVLKRDWRTRIRLSRADFSVGMGAFDNGRSDRATQTSAAGSFPKMWLSPPKKAIVLTSESPKGMLGLARAGVLDLYEGLHAWRIWHLIGIGAIRRRYSRSRLGQVWLTLSTGLLMLMYGGLFSILFKQDPKTLLPYIGVSMILWSVISGSISNAATCLVGAHRYFENQYASFSIAIFVVIYREAITFAHESVIIFALLLYFGLLGDVRIFSALFGLVFVLFTLTWLCYAIAIVCVRYRDVIQVMSSVMRAAFFLTPIFWRESMFPEAYRHYLILNPFHVLLSVMRDPLLGIDTPKHYLTYGWTVSLIGFFLTMIFVGKFRRRIIFWV